MKGTFFKQPLEWNIETRGEVWNQGSTVQGTLSVKNHGAEVVDLSDSGVGLIHAEIKKVHAKTPGILKPTETATFEKNSINPGEESRLSFSFLIGPNAPVTDKKSSFYLGYGTKFEESNLQLKVEPYALYTKIVNLLDTFHRFKVKELKGTKKGVEYKLLPPTSREMANVDSLNLSFSMEDKNLTISFNFQVKILDTSGVTTKINKRSLSLERTLPPKAYSLGADMINQDELLKNVEAVLGEVRLKAVY